MSNTKTKTKFSFLILLILSLCLSAFLFIGQPLTASAAEGELTIAVQPQQSVRYASENTDFSVTVVGGTAPYTYQWQWISGAGYYDNGAWSDISDSDNATLTVAVTEDMSGNFYRCIITDSASATVTSEAAELFVPDLPTINTNLSFAKEHNTALDLAYFSGSPSDCNNYKTMKLIFDGQSFVEPYIRWTSQTTKYYFLSVYPTGKFTAMNETDTWNNESEHGLLVAVSDPAGTLMMKNEIDWQFTQMLTKVDLDLSFDGFATEPTVSDVRIYCGNDYTITYLIKEITADAYTYDANEYSSFTQEGKNSWSSIVVPQTGVRKIEIEIDGTVYTYESAEDITLNSGKAVNLDLTVTSGNTTVAATSAAESDWVTATLGHTFDANGECSCGAVEISDTTFPDATFRTYVSENIDTDSDGVLSTEEIAAVTAMDVSKKGITDLSGIQYFTELTELDLTANKLTSIDISALSKLTILNVRSNENLGSLNLSSNLELEQLNISHCTSLRSLDLSNNINLQFLDASSCVLTSLDLSHSGATPTSGSNSSTSIDHCGVGYVNMNLLGDVSRMEITSGGTMGADGWLLLNPDDVDGSGHLWITYDYDTGNGHGSGAGGLLVAILVNHDDFNHTYVANVTSKDEVHHYTEWCETCHTVNEETVAEHTYSGLPFADETHHWYFCKNCEFKKIEEHLYTSECDENCTNCHIKRDIPREQHTITTYDDYDDTWHVAYCSNCCDYLQWEHEYEFACTEACICGRANPDLVAHTTKYVVNGDMTHDVSCEVCAKLIEDNTACVYEETVNDAYVASEATCISGTTYYKSCECGHKSVETFVAGSPDTTNHDWNDTDVCSGCNAVKISEKTFPDANFRNFILGEYFSPLNEDEIFTTEELSLVKTLTCSGTVIRNLTGIEYFTELTTLKCGSNQLKSVDLSKNTKLTTVDLGEQAWVITIAPDATFDLNTLGIDVSKLTLPEGCTVNNGIIKFEAGVYDLSGLTYPSGYGDTLFNVRLAIENPHSHASVETFDDCSKEEVCLCGDITKSATEHDFSGNYLNDADGHWHKCENCAVTDTKIAHTFNVPDKDSTHHWNKCSDCGAIDEKIKHSATEDGDCTTEEKCSCGTVVIEAKNDHDFDNACDTDCNNDGCEYTRTTEHIPEADDGDCTTDILCSICDAVTTKGNESHTGGTATCTAQAVCAVCGTSYGNTLAHNYTVPQKDGADHWNKCSDCDAIDTKVPHSGTDDDDCTTPVTCSCGHIITEEQDAHDFSGDYLHDANGHWHKCQNCDVTDTKGNHTGGTATCQAQANCSVCGTAYGEALGHDFRGIGMDENEHWSKCSRCDATGEKQAHTIDGGLCTVCEYQPTKDALSGGAIAAIVVASVTVLGGGGFALYWFVFKKKRLI